MTFGIVAIALWTTSYAGYVSEPFSVSLYWHIHEMIFGFFVGVISGFLLTASANWTGLPPISGKKLIYLFALWGTNRVLAYIWLDSWINLLMQALYFVSIVFLLIPYLFPKERRRNQVFAYLLGALGITQLAFLLNLKFADTLLGHIKWGYLALGWVAMMVVIIAGRILPLFTGNAHGFTANKRDQIHKIATVLTGVVFGFISLFDGLAMIESLLFLFLAVLLTWSSLGWGSLKSLSKSLSWSLHLAFFWIVVGSLYLGLSAALSYHRLPGLHAIAYGGLGGMVYSMISRVSLGHTGRPLIASNKTTLGYLLFHLGVIVRVFPILIWPNQYLLFVEISALLWVLSFIILLVNHSSMLVTERPDK